MVHTEKASLSSSFSVRFNPILRISTLMVILESRNWMESWLKNLQWYNSMLVAYDPSFEELFSAPVVTNHWKSKAEDSKEFLNFSMV